MSTTITPPPAKNVNRSGLEVINYKGSKTTLCAGCGHNSISERIVECFYELGVEPWTVAKFSGIGCSSKSPAYFLGLSHGFNGVHGRMPAIATGALLANSTLVGIGLSGDGDTAFFLGDQIVHDQIPAALDGPAAFVLATAVLQIQNRIARLTVVIIRRRIKED